MKLADVLGINARSAQYLCLNTRKARRRADDKLITKKMLTAGKVGHPKLLGVMKNSRQVEKYEWENLREGFVVKPVQGFGGQGIVIIKKQIKTGGKFLNVEGKLMTADDLRIHALDIVEGKYSHNNLPDKVMVEERIKIHPKFKKLSVGGAPDVRVIVYNRVPVMAMLRLPTEESAGKANLHQGAIGLGIDMATGITTHGVYKNNPIRFFHDSKMKVNGIAVPYWTKILTMAVKTQMRSQLAYLSVDFLIDEEKGPVVLELNDQPGLSIQLANMAGLKKRLERVEGLEIDTPEKGVKVAKALFASAFANRVKFFGEERPIVGIFEKVKVKDGKGKWVEIEAKIDTGARSTSIDVHLAKKLGLDIAENRLWKKKVKNSLGIEERRMIEISFRLKGMVIKTRAGVTSRAGLRRELLIGRRDLKDFLVNPALVKVKKK